MKTDYNLHFNNHELPRPAEPYLFILTLITQKQTPNKKTGLFMYVVVDYTLESAYNLALKRVAEQPQEFEQGEWGLALYQKLPIQQVTKMFSSLMNTKQKPLKGKELLDQLFKGNGQ